MARPHQRRNLIVRPAKPSDAAALVALVRELNAHQGDPTDHFTLAVARRAILRRGATVRALIAELDGDPVGFAFLLPAFESAWAAEGFYVSDFHVVELARKRGVGRALMAACAAEAKRRKKTFLWWASKAWNVDAHHFYRTLGAIEEPVMAHALTFAAFNKLAEEGRALLAPKASRVRTKRDKARNTRRA
ncbi:MAG: GNAT family N-acetyltransferase [Rhodospirillaceae bacterium]|nr:GNAT family N-acetyltransferase [Rhodospirillaceae bacterium]